MASMPFFLVMPQLGLQGRSIRSMKAVRSRDRCLWCGALISSVHRWPPTSQWEVCKWSQNRISEDMDREGVAGKHSNTLHSVACDPMVRTGL